MHVRIFLFEISKFKVLTTTHNDESFISSVYFSGVATSPFVAFSVTEQYRTRSRSDNAWFNCTCYHFPQATPGKRLLLQARCWGISSTVLFPVEGGGAIETIYSSSLRSTSLHGPRGEVLPGKMPRICCSLVRIE